MRKYNYTGIRKYERTPIREIDDDGRTIKEYLNPYDLQDEIQDQGFNSTASDIVTRIKNKHKVFGRRFVFTYSLDFETTSNNIPDVI